MAEAARLAPRPALANFEPYLPGRSMEQIKKEYGLKKVIKLASNENPLGPSPKVAAAVKQWAAKAHLYPDGFATELRKGLAKHLSVKPAQVTLGAGSDELIELLAKAYLSPNDEIVVSAHAFIRYKMAGDLMDAKVVTVPMKDLRHDLEAMAKAVTAKTKLIFIANPNNPTGTYNTRDEVEEFLITLPARVLPVFDEAYFEYAKPAKDYPDSLSFFKAGRNLITLRTFSKIYGLAGLRVGYGVAAENVIEALERVRPPFNVNAPAQAAALASLADKNQVKRSLRLVAAEMPKMVKALKELRVECVPSVGNFLLINVAPQRGADVFQAMLEKGVIVRSVDEYGFASHIRVTIGKPEENKMFLKAFKEVRAAI